MIETPQIVETTAQLTAFIPVTVPRTEIQQVMGPGLMELMTALAAQGIPPAGAWFTHHLRMDPDVFDLEIGIPVAVPVAAVGRVQPGQLRAAKVARTEHREWNDMVEEFQFVRNASDHFFRALNEEELSRTGVASGNPISVRALGFIILGHAIHHMEVVKERYL